MGGGGGRGARGEGGCAGLAVGAGGQAVVRIGVIGGGDAQVGGRQAAPVVVGSRGGAVVSGDRVLDGRICLQRHVSLQAVQVDAGNSRPFRGNFRFAFYDRRQRYQLRRCKLRF